MSKLTVAKVTLSSGKIAYLRTMKISDTEQAAQMVSRRADGDAQMLQIMMQRSLLQLLLIQINDKKLTAMEKEDMDSLLTMSEFNQLLRVVQKMSGGDELGKEPALELVASA